MEQFFLDLRPEIEEAVRHAMEKIRREVGQEHIYSAALVTDSDCTTLFLAVNTEEALTKRDQADQTPERLTELRNYWAEELVNQVADGSFSLNRYDPDEWGYSDGTDSGLNQVSNRLCDQEEKLSDADDIPTMRSTNSFRSSFWRRRPLYSRRRRQRASLDRRPSASSSCQTMTGRRKSRMNPPGGSIPRSSMSSSGPGRNYSTDKRMDK